MTFVWTDFRVKGIKKNKAIEWGIECEKAFRKLKEICKIIPILANAYFSKAINLHADHSVKWT